MVRRSVLATMKSTRAAVLFETNKQLKVVNNLLIPKLKFGQVLVENAYSGVCHSQVMEINGARGIDNYLPHLLGHEATGVVKKIGEGVKKVKVGDWVISGWIKGKGIDAGGTQYKLDGVNVNAGAVTTFSDLSVVSENRLVKLPKGIPPRLGVVFGCAVPTGSGIFMNDLKMPINSSIAIFGMGGIGLSSLIMSCISRTNFIICIDTNPDKLQLSKEIGANEVIDASKENPIYKIKKLTDNLGVNFAIEAAGKTATIEMAFQSVKKFGGLCVFASHPPEGSKISLDPFELISGKQIRGSWGGGVLPDIDIPKIAGLHKKNKLPYHLLLDKTYELEDINLAISDLEKGNTRRPIIKLSKNLDC